MPLTLRVYRTNAKEKADTLIFPNEDFIYVMKWKEKKKNTTILKIYLCLRKGWENKYFNQRNIPLKILNVF